LVLLVATAALAFGATAATSGSTTQPRVASTPAAVAGKVNVRYVVKRFVRRGNRLYAYGTAIARYKPASGSAKIARHAFRAPVAVRASRFSAQTICPVLELTIGQVDLNLLGAMIHLDKVHLVITADSEGGILGRLLCSLSKSGKLQGQTSQLNFAAQRSGLATNGIGITASVGQTGSSAAAPSTICPVLDLTLGPVDLNLLGLMVHLDTVHLTITADSEGGILGSLLCSLAGQ
jgi:hypothetical protein